MKENKLVTWEMFKKYHEQLVGYIEARDGLSADGKEIDDAIEVIEDGSDNSEG